MSTQEQPGIQTFTAASLREALAQVRRELGSEALIMGQSQVGQRVVVEACAELPAAVDSIPAQQQPEPAQVEADGAVIVAESAQAMNEEERLLQMYTDAGYDNRVVAEMAGCADLGEFRRTVVNRLNFAHKPIAGLRGCYRFTGAAGVGKSATLIKVLVEWVLRNSARDVVVISTDNERLAGSESLQLACQMLSVPMRECNPGDLSQALVTLGSKTLVLVDSPAAELNKPLTAVSGLHDLWVCSALHGPANLAAQHRAVQVLRPLGVVLTQVDQLAAADTLVNLLYQWRLPLYWLGTSSHLPEGIDLADPETLYRNLFGVHEPLAVKLAV